MKAIMVMYDSLNRHYLSPYSCDWVKTPNFERLAERAVVFDKNYIGSFPTIPTRRELHTGRYNFLHRSWGPLEPFDDSMPSILARNGVHTHLLNDCQHYWEDGGSTYHQRYSSHEFFRGQEGDKWKGEVKGHQGFFELQQQDAINRSHVHSEEDFPQSRTFARGLELIGTNRDQDNWFLQIETFDPHEPHYAPEKYRRMYAHDLAGPFDDWPHFSLKDLSPERIHHYRCEYAALVSMCDASLGKVLDAMDELDLWDDTMLIVNTDHGYMLGEHGHFGKGKVPLYEEVSHTPLLIWDPRTGVKGERRGALVQTIDLAPTLLDFFGVAVPPDMQGKPLGDTVATDAPVREAGLFGLLREHLYCVTDRHVYMRAPATKENGPLFDYTLMPCHMRAMFSIEELRDLELAGPFSFTKGLRVLKIPVDARPERIREPNTLWDLETDRDQEAPIHDPALEQRMIERMVALMKGADAPVEQYARLGLDP